jgi:TIGR03009 family protein
MCAFVAELAEAGQGQSPAAKQSAAPSAKAAARSEAPAQAPPTDAAAAIQLERVLKGWEQKSSKIKTLSARFTRHDVMAVTGTTRTFEGWAELKSPDLAYLNLSEIPAVKGEKQDPLTERIVCTGKEVWQYDNETKQIFIFPLARDQARKAFEEGPLPFLFNFRVEQAKKRYRFSLGKVIAPEAAKPGLAAKSGLYVIHIEPLLAIDKQEFQLAQVLLNRETFLPEAIKLTAPNGKDTKLYKFPNIKDNVTVDDSYFIPKEFKGWKVVRNPEAGGAPAAAAQPAPGRGAMPKNAQAPRLGRTNNR